MSTSIKICGITREEDIRVCEELGVDYVGFNFVPVSPRYITPKRARELAQGLKNAASVGIFLADQIADIPEIALRAGLAYAQVYADREVDLDIPGVTIIRAFRFVPSEEFLRSIVKKNQFILLDGPKNGEHAKTDAIAALPDDIRAHLFIAGGLNPANVAETIQTTRPFGVDIASGVERAPGIKDAAKISDLVQAVRLAAGNGRANTVSL